MTKKGETKEARSVDRGRVVAYLEEAERDAVRREARRESRTVSDWVAGVIRRALRGGA